MGVRWNMIGLRVPPELEAEITSVRDELRSANARSVGGRGGISTAATVRLLVSIALSCDRSALREKLRERPRKDGGIRKGLVPR
jgi:hypothetical protein